FHLLDVHQVRVGVDVDEHGGGPDRVDGHDRGGRRVGHGDHFVALADSHGLKREPDRVGAVVDTDAVGHPVVVRELRLERGDTSSQDEATGGEDRLDGVDDVVVFVAIFVQVIPDQ